MPRIRRFDCSKIYKEPWNSQCRDLVFYLIGVESDNYGLLKDTVPAWSATLGLPRSKIQNHLDYLLGQEVFFRYSDGSQGYLATRKWQDYQKVKYPGFPECPVPPPNILGRLSQETQELFTRLLGETSAKDGTAVAGGFLEGCTDANASAVNPVEAGKNYYLDRLRKHTGLESPEFPFGQASGFFARRVRLGDDYEDLKDTIDEFFDRYIRGDKSAGNFGHYQRVYNALCIAVQKRREGNRANTPT